MAEEIILKVGVEGTGDGETKIKSLKTQLREMKEELVGLDEGSDRFKQLSQQAGELEDKIGDVNERVKALSSDTKRLDALVRVGSAIAGGFQAAQGAMALFGSDSKKVEEAIKNIIAVQGILNGVQQVGIFLTTKQNGVSILDTATKYANAAATKVAAAAQWLWNVALSANPISLIVIGVTALTAAIIAFAKPIKEFITNWDNLRIVMLALIGPIGWIIIAYEKLFGAEAKLADQREAEAKRRAEETAKETAAHKERLKQIREERDLRLQASDDKIAALELEKLRLEANGKSSAEITIQILEEEAEKTRVVLDSYRKQFQSAIDYYTNLAAISGKSTEDFKEEMRLRGIPLDEFQKKAEKIISDQEIEVEKSELAITKFKREQSEERADIAQQEADERKRIADKEAADAEEARIKQEEIDLENWQNYQELIKNRKQFLIDEEQRRLDEEFDLMEAQIDRENAAKDLQEQQENERKARNLKTAEDFANASINLVNTVFTLTNRLGKQDDASKEARAKRQFQISKALQLGLAVMDGYKAVTASLAQSPVAIGPIPNPAGIASLAFAISTSLANIAKIGASQYGGGASADLSAGSPNISSGGDSVGNTTPNITPIQAGSTFLNPEPQKVYVLEKEITGTQKKVSAIEAEATF